MCLLGGPYEYSFKGYNEKQPKKWQAHGLKIWTFPCDLSSEKLQLNNPYGSVIN